MNNNRKSHNRIVFECYTQLKNDVDMKRTTTILRRYGKETREQALKMLREDAAKKRGMTLEEYEKWLLED